MVLLVAAVTTDQSSAVLWTQEMCFEIHSRKRLTGLANFPLNLKILIDTATTNETKHCEDFVLLMVLYILKINKEQAILSLLLG